MGWEILALGHHTQKFVNNFWHQFPFTGGEGDVHCYMKIKPQVEPSLLSQI